MLFGGAKVARWGRRSFAVPALTLQFCAVAAGTHLIAMGGVPGLVLPSFLAARRRTVTHSPEKNSHQLERQKADMRVGEQTAPPAPPAAALLESEKLGVEITAPGKQLRFASLSFRARWRATRRNTCRTTHHRGAFSSASACVR